MPSISVRVSPELAKRINQAANKQRKKASDFIRNCIEQQLFPSQIDQKSSLLHTELVIAREKLMFKANLETLLITRSLLSSIDDAKIQPIIDKANDLTKKYYDEKN